MSQYRLNYIETNKYLGLVCTPADVAGGGFYEVLGVDLSEEKDNICTTKWTFNSFLNGKSTGQLFTQLNYNFYGLREDGGIYTLDNKNFYQVEPTSDNIKWMNLTILSDNGTAFIKTEPNGNLILLSVPNGSKGKQNVDTAVIGPENHPWQLIQI